MSRHQGLTVLLVVLVIASAGAWIYGLSQEPAEPPAPEAQVPAWMAERLETAESRIAELSKLPPPPAPEPAPPQPPPMIERVDVNGQDVADLLGISLWKFQFRLPAAQYTLYVWTEHWTREAVRPEYRLLLTGSARWGEDHVTLKLPLEEDPRLFIRVGDLFGESDPAAQPVGVPRPIGWAVMDRVLPLETDRPVHLVTLTHNDAGMAIARLRDAHRQNDETVYVMIGFTRGEYVPFEPAKWIAGHESAAQ